MIFIENMYASSHFTEIAFIAWENQGEAAQEWAPTLQYFTKLYADHLASQNRYVGEKPHESSAQVKTTALPSSCGSTNSLTDAYLNTTEREAAFITYVKVLEDQITALKNETTVASSQTRLTVGGNRASSPT